MATNILAKTFSFGIDAQKTLSYDPAFVRVSRSARLQPQATSGTIRTATTIPRAAIELVGFEAVGLHVDAVRFRLGGATDDSSYWFDGAQWVPATADEHWNTELEVAAAIGSFISPRAFSVVAQLAPDAELAKVKIAYRLRVVSFIEDIIYRSLVRNLKAKLRPITDVLYEMPSASSTVSVPAVVQKANIHLNVVDVDAVFLPADDPELLNDLLVSYDAVQKRATVNSTIAAGKRLQFSLAYEPEVIVEAASPDFMEIEKVPAIIIGDVEEVDSSPLATGEHVVNKSDGSVVVIPAPYRGTLRFSMTLMTNSGPDLLRLASAVKRYTMENPILRSRAVDEGYRLFLRDEFTSTTRPSPAGIRTATARFEIIDVLEWRIPSQIIPDGMVKHLNLQLGGRTTVVG